MTEVSSNGLSKEAQVTEKESDSSVCGLDSDVSSLNECEDKIGASGSSLSAAQRARVERNRLKARALQDARLVNRPNAIIPVEVSKLDSGGGFLVEEVAAPPGAARAPPAPVADPARRPRCLACARPFACSHLLDTFDHPVCDACRDDEGEHALMTRTEAKAEFLLKDCDLDARAPPLRCVRRRNPHRGGADMRLYLRAQLLQRALQVWGSAAALDAERARRDEARARTLHAQTQRRLRALRMDVRSSLYDRTRARHHHAFGPEARVAHADDTYERTCLTCGHRETYEKM